MGRANPGRKKIDSFGALRGIGPMTPSDELTADPPPPPAANKPRKQPQTGKQAKKTKNATAAEEETANHAHAPHSRDI